MVGLCPVLPPSGGGQKLSCRLAVHLFWRLEIQRAVRSSCVIQSHRLIYCQPSLSHTVKFILKKILLLEYAVDTLSHGIFGAMILLGHTNLQSVAKQAFNIFMAAILTAAVRVMDRPCSPGKPF